MKPSVMAHFDPLLRCNPLAIRHDLVWYSPDQPMPARVMSPNRWVSSVLFKFVDLQEMLVGTVTLVDRMKRASGSHETLVGTMIVRGCHGLGTGSLECGREHWT